MAHVGLKTTKRTLERYFYWPGMSQDVDVALSTCVGCLHRQTTDLKKGEHHGKQIPPNKCHKVYVDIIGPVSIKLRKKYLLTHRLFARKVVYFGVLSRVLTQCIHTYTQT